MPSEPQGSVFQHLAEPSVHTAQKASGYIQNSAEHQDGGTAQPFHSPGVTSGIAAVPPPLPAVPVTGRLHALTPSTGLSLTARVCVASLALAVPVHVQGFLWRVCALPLPSCDPAHQPATWVMDGRTRTQHFSKLFFAVSDDLQHLERPWRARGTARAPGCFLC